MTALFAFLVVFGVVVLVHECGHFFAARCAGVRVEEFGFGFPPRLVSKKIGATIYSLNLIPIGGFVRLYGEGGEGVREPDSFAAQSFARRLSIVVAGVVMNALLCILILTILLSVGSTQPLTGVYPKAKITKRALVVTQVLPESPAARGGITPGDTLLTANGTRVESVEDLQKLVAHQSGQQVRVQIERAGTKQELMVVPEALKNVEGRVAIGVGLEIVATVSYPVYLAPWYAMKESWALTTEMWSVLTGLVHKIFIQRTTHDLGVAGPIGIAVLSGRFARAGAQSFLFFIALLSLNLALLNILPLPALDGGRAAIIIGERLAGRALHKRIETVVQTIGIIFILLLALLVTLEDIRMYAPMIVHAFSN